MQDVLEFLKKAEQFAVYHRLSAAEVEKAKVAVEEARAALETAKAEHEESKRSYEDAIDECPVESLSRTKVRKMLEDRVDQMVELGLLVLPEEATDAPKPAPRKRRSRKKKDEREAPAVSVPETAAGTVVAEDAAPQETATAPAVQEEAPPAEAAAPAEVPEPAAEATPVEEAQAAELAEPVEEPVEKVEPVAPERVAVKSDPFAAAIGKAPAPAHQAIEPEDTDEIGEDDIPDEMVEEVMGDVEDEAVEDSEPTASQGAQDGGIKIPSFLLGGN